MRLVQDKPELIITPDVIFAKNFTEDYINKYGTAQIHDSIKEAVSDAGGILDNLSFKYNGIYPNIFKNYEEALQFKVAIDAFVAKTESDTGNVKVKNVDDILFITFFTLGYEGSVYGSNTHNKYLDELVEVFIGLLNRDLTPTDENFIWRLDPVTGIGSNIDRNQFSKDYLIMEGGYKTVARMIGPRYMTFHLPNDSPVILKARSDRENDMILPEGLSKKVTGFIMDYIIKEHETAKSKFYKDLCDGYINTRIERPRYRWYTRKNKVLFFLIQEIDKYLRSTSRFKVIKKNSHVFIYDLLCILGLIEPPYKVDVLDKSTVIKTILRDNGARKRK